MTDRMTKEEAIIELEALKQFLIGKPFANAEDFMALDMAIKALKKEAERQEMVIRASERHLGIVRCKDCKYCWYDDYTESLECRHNKGLNEEIYGNDFCCYGERREP